MREVTNIHCLVSARPSTQRASAALRAVWTSLKWLPRRACMSGERPVAFAHLLWLIELDLLFATVKFAIYHFAIASIPVRARALGHICTECHLSPGTCTKSMNELKRDRYCLKTALEDRVLT